MICPNCDWMMKSEMMMKRMKETGKKFKFTMKRHTCPKCHQSFVDEKDVKLYHKALKKYQRKVERRKAKPR